MKTTLILTTPALRNGLQVGAIAAALSRSTLELERDIKENIANSRPAGRTYRRTALVRKSSRRTNGLKLSKRPGGNLVVGSTFHRASRRGQPPAIDTGGLINSIRSSKMSVLRYRINVGKAYGTVLDDPDGLGRPFFSSRVDLYRPTFLENIRRAVLGK